MRNWMRRAAMAAVLGGAVMGVGIRAMAIEPGPGPATSGPVSLEDRLKILDLKIEVAKLQGQFAGGLIPGTPDAAKAQAQSALAKLDQIYAILEDMLQNG